MNREKNSSAVSNHQNISRMSDDAGDWNSIDSGRACIRVTDCRFRAAEAVVPTRPSEIRRPLGRTQSAKVEIVPAMRGNERAPRPHGGPNTSTGARSSPQLGPRKCQRARGRPDRGRRPSRRHRERKYIPRNQQYGMPWKTHGAEILINKKP